jgi:hypothetical protein
LAVDSSASPIIVDPELPAAGPSISLAVESPGLDPKEPVLELPTSGPSISLAMELDPKEPVSDLPTAGPSISLAVESPGLDPKEPVSDLPIAASTSPFSLLQQSDPTLEFLPCAVASLPLQSPASNVPPVALSLLAQHSPLEAPAVVLSPPQQPVITPTPQIKIVNPLYVKI